MPVRKKKKPGLNTRKQKMVFNKQWQKALDRLQKLHQKGNKAGLLRKNLHLTAGTKKVR